MKKQQLFIKKKICNHLMITGNKFTCEKFLFKNIKLIHKSTKKNYKELIKSSITNLVPTIQLRRIKIKKRKSVKEFPYVLKQTNRISLGIKKIIGKPTKTVKDVLFRKIISISKNKNELLKMNEIMQSPLLLKKKKVFFRWFF